MHELALPQDMVVPQGKDRKPRRPTGRLDRTLLPEPRRRLWGRAGGRTSAPGSRQGFFSPSAQTGRSR